MRLIDDTQRTCRRAVRIFALLLAVLALPTFASCKTRKYKLPVETLVIQQSDGRSVSVEAEIAVKKEERNWGFMERKNIPDGTGMLFVFESDQVLHFWMKNTPHPLSIAYIDSNGKITDVLDMTPYSLESVSSCKSVRYALEVPQGWFAAQGVKVGDYVSADGNSLRNKF